MSAPVPAPPGVNAAIPSYARIYDYMLGGKDNFAVDRAIGDKILETFPQSHAGVRANRAFLGRVTRFLSDAGITQFLDIGAGLPTQDNVHQVAQKADPETRVVYVDNDPIVLVHARALLATNSNVKVVEADLRRPAELLGHPTVTEHLDLTRPVAVLLFAVLHDFADLDQARSLVRYLGERVAPGSYLAISHITSDGFAGRTQKATDLHENAGAPIYPRTGDEITTFFDGWDLLDPGVVQISRWRPEEDSRPSATKDFGLGGLAVKR